MAIFSSASLAKKTKPSVGSRQSHASRRHHSAKPADADGETKTKKPDMDELRRRRAAYFEKPVAERHKVIRPKASHTSPATVKSKATTTSVRPRKTTSRSHKSSRTSNSRKAVKEPSEGERRTADYVYGPRPTSRDGLPIVTEEVMVEVPASESRSRDHRRHSHHGSTRRRSSETLAEDDELAPDDSISVVATRRMSRSQASLTATRPSIKRSSTASAKLATIDEAADKHSSTSRRTSKRESTLLGGLLRRQSTTALPTPPRLVECLTCASDDVPRAKSAKLACGHRMCHDCLKRVFEMSVSDPAHMPPRCCTDEHIPLKHVDKIFDDKFKLQWNRKYQEYHTKNRVYCVAPKCGEWIKPSHVHRDTQGRKYAQCSRCKTKVCTSCNNKMHKSRDCPKDPEIAKLVEQAKDKGWQRCHSCSALVELREGCNHMTCRCLAEFCMICGAKWKTCECPWFNNTTLAHPDRLHEMRVPEPIQVIYRRVFNAAAPAAPPVPAVEQRPQAEPPRRRTYQDEMEQRRRQEQSDAELARRLQLALSMGDEDERPARRRDNTEIFGLGNADFMNDNFVQDAANVVMNAFGDANFGRRGERTSGRRRRARQTEQNAGEAGLVPNFLGEESVLGIAPARRSERAPT